MKIFNFAIKMLKKEYKRAILYGGTLLFAIVLCFMFCSIIENGLFIGSDIASGYGTWDSMDIPLSKAVPFVVISTCCFMIIYASNYYLGGKANEFALIESNGNSTYEATIYAYVQMFIITVVVTILALIIATPLTKYMNIFLYDYLAITNYSNAIPQIVYLETLSAVGLLFVVMMIGTAGFLYRNDVLMLLNRRKKVTTVKINDRKIIWVQVFLYFMGFYYLFPDEHSVMIYLFPIFLGMVGAVGIIKQGIPRVIRFWKMKKGIEKKYSLIYLSNYSTTVQKTANLILILMIMVLGIIPLLVTQSLGSNEYITGLLGYIVVVILLVISIAYKIAADIQDKCFEASMLNKVGYTVKEIKKMITAELILVHFTIIIIPFPYILILGLRFIKYSGMQWPLLLVCILIYVIPLILSLIILSVVSNKVIVKQLQKKL